MLAREPVPAGESRPNSATTLIPRKRSLEVIGDGTRVVRAQTTSRHGPVRRLVSMLHTCSSQFVALRGWLPGNLCRAVFTVAALWLHGQPKRMAHRAFWSGPCHDTAALLIDDYVKPRPGPFIPLPVNAKKGVRTLLRHQVLELPGTVHPAYVRRASSYEEHDDNETEDELPDEHHARVFCPLRRFTHSQCSAASTVDQHTGRTHISETTGSRRTAR
ncbi:hypothetical protein C8Q80DRAFT_312232 [Daedaleopsis nitida]|nr:hypothetical protein C8Q80DRAFT_312232 [Daedaleopsis nitida]